MIENLRLGKEGTYGTLPNSTTTMYALSQGFDTDFEGFPDADSIPLCANPDTCANNNWNATLATITGDRISSGAYTGISICPGHYSNYLYFTTSNGSGSISNTFPMIGKAVRCVVPES